MYVKCCGFNEQSSIKTAINNHVDAIGFITYPKSKRYVDHHQIQYLCKDIPDEIDKVAVVVNPTMNEINHLMNETSINVIQFHGDESEAFIQTVNVRFPNLKMIKALPANENLSKQIEVFKDSVDFLIIDTPTKQYGGSGKSFDWELLREIKQTPFLIAGGLNIEKIQQIEQLDLNHNGYDISSGIETNGVKDSKKIEELLTKLKG